MAQEVRLTMLLAVTAQNLSFHRRTTLLSPVSRTKEGLGKKKQLEMRKEEGIISLSYPGPQWVPESSVK